MRKFMIGVLLASTMAIPAVAQDSDSRGRNRDRASQPAASSGERVRPQRAERRAERASQRVEAREAGGSDRARVRRESYSGPVEVRERPVIERRSREPSLVERVRERRAEQPISQRRIEGRRTRIVTPEVVARGTVPTYTRDRTASGRHTTSGRQWNNHWRSDRRYDWRRHRDRNRSIFRFGRYGDPYGYRYRQFSIGFNLWPSYYGSQFWLDDPWQYRLPPAYGPYRWIRYYDDALLVNIYTGQVVDVEYGFFW